MITDMYVKCCIVLWTKCNRAAQGPLTCIQLLTIYSEELMFGEGVCGLRALRGRLCTLRVHAAWLLSTRELSQQRNRLCQHGHWRRLSMHSTVLWICLPVAYVSIHI